MVTRHSWVSSFPPNPLYAETDAPDCQQATPCTVSGEGTARECVEAQAYLAYQEDLDFDGDTLPRECGCTSCHFQFNRWGRE